MARRAAEPQRGPVDLEGGYDQIQPGGLGGPLYKLAGELHRLNGPAIIWVDGTELWYCSGQLHRDGGPAVVRTNGNNEYWEHGQRVANGSSGSGVDAE